MRRSSLLIVFLIVLIDLIGFGIVIPILPYYAKAYGASAWQLGWLMAVYSLMQFLVSPLWGRLSDRVGRRPVLLFSVGGTAASMAVLGWAPSLTWLFIGRTLAGVFGANISTANAYIADTTTPENRAKGMGLIGAAFGLGFILGPAIGGILSGGPHGYSLPIFLAAGMALANLIFAWFKLPEPNLSVQAREGNRFKRFDLSAYREAFGDPRTRLATCFFLLVTFAIVQMETTFAIYMGLKFNFDAKQAGMLLAISGVIMVAMQGGIVGRLVKKFGEVRLIMAGLIICAIGLYGFSLSFTVVGIIVALVLMSLGHGALHPSLSSLASLGAAPEKRGLTMGVFQSASSFARVIGPPIAGWAYDAIGVHTPFNIGAIVLVAGFAIALASMSAVSERTRPRMEPGRASH